MAGLFPMAYRSLPSQKSLRAASTNMLVTDVVVIKLNGPPSPFEMLPFGKIIFVNDLPSNPGAIISEKHNPLGLPFNLELFQKIKRKEFKENVENHPEGKEASLGDCSIAELKGPSRLIPKYFFHAFILATSGLEVKKRKAGQFAWPAFHKIHET